MKKLLLTAVAASTIAVTAKAQTIPNGNFENWNSAVVDLPNNWFSSAGENPEVATTSKTSDSRSGSAIKLESKVVENGNVSFGFFTNTDGDPTIGEGGAPYSQQPTSISGYYKGTFVTGDSAIMLVIFKKNGVPISENFFKIGTNANAYTAFSFPLTVDVIPDSVVFGFASSDVIENQDPPAGNIIFVDDISFNGPGITQQLANSNFDSWTSETRYGFIGWNALSPEVTRTTDHYKGVAAAYIPVIDFGDGMAFGGNMSLGEPVIGSTGRQGVPFSATDDTLTFYYKFNSVEGDTAIVFIGLYKAGSPVGGDLVILEPSANYTLKSIPLVAGIAPDTLSINFAVAQGQARPAHPGSELFIDEVTLSSEPLNTGLFNWTKTAAQSKVYPNPMNTELNVWVGGYKNVQYSIMDITGKELLNGTANGNPINVSELHPGIYFVTLSSKGEVLATQKVVKN